MYLRVHRRAFLGNLVFLFASDIQHFAVISAGPGPEQGGVQVQVYTGLSDVLFVHSTGSNNWH